MRPETARLRDRVAGTALLAVSLVWIVLVYQTVEPSQGTEAGPRAFPLFFGIVLAALSLIVLFQGFRPPPAGDDNNIPAFMTGELQAVAWTIGGLVVYGLILEPLGFMPATFLVVTALLVLVLHVRSPVLIAAMAIGLSLGSYLVFGKLLGTYLPPGTLITIYF